MLNLPDLEAVFVVHIPSFLQSRFKEGCNSLLLLSNQILDGWLSDFYRQHWYNTTVWRLRTTLQSCGSIEEKKKIPDITEHWERREEN